MLIRTILRTLQDMMSLPDHDNYTLPTYKKNTIRPLNKNSFLQIFNNTYHKNVMYVDVHNISVITNHQYLRSIDNQSIHTSQ